MLTRLLIVLDSMLQPVRLPSLSPLTMHLSGFLRYVATVTANLSGKVKVK